MPGKPRWMRPFAREADLEADILTLLAYYHIPAWRTHDARNHPAQPGISDVIGVLPGGRFLAIECKAHRGVVTKEQGDFIHAVNLKGGLAFVARRIQDVQVEIRRATCRT